MGLHVMAVVWVAILSAALHLDSVQGAECRTGHETNYRCSLPSIFTLGVCRNWPCNLFTNYKIELGTNTRCGGQHWCLDAMPCCLFGGQCQTACTGSQSKVLQSDCTANGHSCCVGKREVTVTNPTCGLVPRARIINGSPVTRKAIPWMVRLVDSDTSHTLCSGVLVGSDTVLTAAHCVSNLVTKLHKVRAGIDGETLDVQEVLIKLKSVIIAKHFQLGNKENDIAVLKLNNTKLKLTSICLPSASHQLTETCRLSGFGWNNAAEATLRSGAAKPMNKKLCSNIINGSLAQDVICADISKSKIGAQARDDGGAMECLGKDGRYYLVGVIRSYVSNNWPVQVTAVASHLEFIKQYL